MAESKQDGLYLNEQEHLQGDKLQEIWLLSALLQNC
jgi:hypothetical protein